MEYSCRDPDDGASDNTGGRNQQLFSITSALRSLFYMQSVGAFSLTTKCVTLDDVDGGFTLIYVFRRQYNQLGPGSLSFEDYCERTKTHKLLADKMFSKDHMFRMI